MKKSISVVVMAAAALAGQAFAQAQDKPLSADAELGLLTTSGNTNSTALKAKLNLKHELTRWRNQYVLEALYKEDQLEVEQGGEIWEESQVTAEKYFASAQADYKLDSQHRALFVFGSYEEDKFSGYDYQAAVAVGYSDRLFQGTSSFLDYSVGPGMSFSRTDEVRAADGTLLEDNLTEESAMVRLSVLYQYDFSETAKFTQTFASDVAVESGANTKTKAESAVTANINQSLAMKASFTITHNSEVPEDRVSSDRQTAITLVYSF
jgi:putative salt-induced outer membrane protein YdiY